MADTGWIDAAHSVESNGSATYPADAEDWVGDDDPWVTAIRWDEADFSLPGGETITQVDINIYTNNANGDPSERSFAFHPYNSDGQTDPDGETAADVLTNCAAGTAWATGITSLVTPLSYHAVTMGGTAVADVVAAFTAGGFVSVGLIGESTPWQNGERIEIDSVASAANVPQMKITYTTAGNLSLAAVAGFGSASVSANMVRSATVSADGLSTAEALLDGGSTSISAIAHHHRMLQGVG